MKSLCWLLMTENNLKTLMFWKFCFSADNEDDLIDWDIVLKIRDAICFQWSK